MTDLPLQPSLRPPGRGWTLLVGLTILTLVAWLPVVLPGRHEPPRLILGGPGATLDAARQLERHVAGAHRRLWVAFYVVRYDEAGPIAALLEGFAAAARSGVDVRVVLDRERSGVEGREDKNARAAAWLVAQGVRVVWDEEAITTHAKVVLADDRVWIGSHNGTRAALSVNREAAVLLDDPGLAAEVATWFEGIPGFR